MFAPLVYWTFLSSYFGTAQPSSMLFSYATHIDDGQGDVTDFDMPTSGGNVSTTLGNVKFHEWVCLFPIPVCTCGVSVSHIKQM